MLRAEERSRAGGERDVVALVDELGFRLVPRNKFASSARSAPDI